MDQRDLETARAKHWMRRHLLLFAGANTGLFVADLLLPGPIWFVYPLVFWGAALAMHIFYAKSVYLDPGWAERRTRRIRQLSYDHRHIEQIEAAPRGAGELGPDPQSGGAAATENGGEQSCRRKM